MFKKTALILCFSCAFSLNAFASFTAISAAKLQAKQKAGVAIIDIRRVDEFRKYGIIAGAHKLTLFDKNGKYDLPKWRSDLAKIVPNKDTPFVLVCAHANRTKTIGHFLDKKTEYNNIFELSGGINNGWIDKGLATTKIPANSGKAWYKFW